jgi:DNA polymerase-1
LRRGNADADDADDVSPLLSGSLADGTDYTYVCRACGLAAVEAAVEESVAVGLDCETTGLDPRRDRARLLQLAPDSCAGTVYLLDLFSLDRVALATLFEALAGVEVVGHNLAFDLAFLAPLGFTPGKPPHDLMIRSRLLTAGTRDGNALADLAQRHLGVTLDKGEQKGDWAAPALTEAQLRYAAADVAHLLALHQVLAEEVSAAGLEATVALEERCLPAWVWMATAGMPLDRQAWRVLAERSRAQSDRLWAALAGLAPPQPGTLPGLSGWNFNSTDDVLAVLKALGLDAQDTRDATLAGLEHPFVDALREYRQAKWLDGTYGEAFLRWERGGRVYGGWNQTGNEAGRSSCKEPNLQGVPRQKEYRRAFVAPPGKALVKADFAAAHLRIVARLAGEQKMLAAFRAGHDLHRLTAQALLGKEDITQQDRQLAKAVAFGLLYGMGARGLRDYALQSYGVALSLAEAERHHATFFRAYPALKRWHRDTEAGRARQTEARSLGGRRRLLDPKTPLMHRLNSPVLGTEADGAKAALALLWERRADCPGARPVAFVHDEIVVECDEAQAEQAKAWLRQAMLDGLAPLIEPVPVEVEVSAGRTWAGD